MSKNIEKLIRAYIHQNNKHPPQALGTLDVGLISIVTGLGTRSNFDTSLFWILDYLAA